MTTREALRTDSNFFERDGIFIHTRFTTETFEQTYLDLRSKEGRVYDDGQLATLPDINRDHPLVKEWEIRKRSMQRLMKYLQQNAGARSILEVGCGNGWLAHNLSKMEGTEIVGLDVNITELLQAARVFKQAENLSFMLANIFELNLTIKFNYVILASSIQYFHDIPQLIAKLKSLLADSGELHILDSPIYTRDVVSDAQKRSADYFASQRSAMVEHYHHHTEDDLAEFNPQLLFDPSDLLAKIKRKFTVDSPFPWVKIAK